MSCANLLAAVLLILSGAAMAQTASPPPSALGQPRPVPLVKPPASARPHKPPLPKPPAHKAVKPAKPAHPPVVVPPAAPAPPAPTLPPPPKIDPTKGTTTGLKLPRYVSFRSDDVNLRSGPGMQYPIDWQYHRRDLPVRVLREYEVWRLVEMQDGTKGWVHQATLTGRRGFIVTDAERVLRAAPDDTAAPVARLEPGVVGHIRACEAAKPWCEVQTGDYRGWLPRTQFWGVDLDEAVN